MTDLIDATTLTPAEHALVDEIAARRDEIVELACELIRFDTQSREEPTSPAREDAALQAGAGGPAARPRARRSTCGSRRRTRWRTTR